MTPRSPHPSKGRPSLSDLGQPAALVNGGVEVISFVSPLLPRRILLSKEELNSDGVKLGATVVPGGGDGVLFAAASRDWVSERVGRGGLAWWACVVLVIR